MPDKTSPDGPPGHCLHAVRPCQATAAPNRLRHGREGSRTPGASSSSTSRRAGPRTTSWPAAGACSARGRWATPGRSTPTRPGCSSSGVGRATRLLRFASALPKIYVGEVVLGVTTSTLDASGEVTGHFDMGGHRAGGGPGGGALADGSHRAGPADGLGRQGRRTPPARARPRGDRGGAGARGVEVFRFEVFETGESDCLPGPRRMLVGHLRARAGGRSRGEARRWRPPEGAAQGVGRVASLTSRRSRSKTSRPSVCARPRSSFATCPEPSPARSSPGARPRQDRRASRARCRRRRPLGRARPGRAARGRLRPARPRARQARRRACSRVTAPAPVPSRPRATSSLPRRCDTTTAAP